MAGIPASIEFFFILFKTTELGAVLENKQDIRSFKTIDKILAKV